MSENATYIREVNVASSVFSGLIVLLFDIVLLGVIRANIQLLCATTNLYLIYDKRSAVSPTKSRLGCLSGSPVGQKRLVRLFSVLVLAATAAIIVLGFSINGKTVEKFEEQTYRSMIIRASEPPVLDVENEVILSRTEGASSSLELSTRVVAILSMHACVRANFTHVTEYAYAYKNVSLDKSMVNSSTVLHPECVTENQFKNEHTLNVMPMITPINPFNCEFVDLVPSFEEDLAHGFATFSPSSDCDLNISRLSCFKIGSVSCAGAGVREEGDEKKAYIVVVLEVGDPSSVSISQIPLQRDEILYERVALNSAFFSRITGGGALAYFLAQIVFSDVAENVTLKPSLGKYEISEIDLRLAIPTVGFLCAITIVLGISSFIFWLQTVYFKGRVSYNSFCTVAEVLALSDEAKETKLKNPKDSKKYIGVRNDTPVLGITTIQNCSKSEWDENEIR